MYPMVVALVPHHFQSVWLYVLTMGFELRADVEYPVYLVQVPELQISVILALRSAVFEFTE